MRDERAILQDIIESGDLIRKLVRGKSFSQFVDDDATREAVMRRLAIIGEAARLLSDRSRNSMPAIPWDQIVRMRNILIHVYHAVRLERVWETVENDLDPLIATVRERLEALNNSDSGDPGEPT